LIQHDQVNFDRFNSLKIFLKIAHEASFTRAAERLGVSKSQVTKEIKKLEEHLGTPLFYRTTRSVTLTETGKSFQDKARNILNLFEEAEEEIKNQKQTARGHLRITAPAILGQKLIAGLIAEFQIANPYVEVDLVLTDRVIDIVEDGFDLSIRTSSTLKDSNLFHYRLGNISRVICASPKYLKKFGTPKRLEDLHNHNCVLFIRGNLWNEWQFQKGDKLKTLTVDGNYRTNNILAQIEATKAGMGIANLPAYLVEEEIKKGKLVPLFKSWNLPGLDMFVLYHQKRTTSRKLDVLLTHLEDKLGDI